MQPIPVPLTMAEVIRRVASTDAANKTWTCPICGEIPARELRQAPGYYIRQPCACEERQRDQEAQARWQTRQRADSQEQIYTWVGRDWADLTLLDQTFATFEHHRQPEACEVARAFVAQPRGTLVLFGGYGTGKTHLLAAMTVRAAHRINFKRYWMRIMKGDSPDYLCSAYALSRLAA